MEKESWIISALGIVLTSGLFIVSSMGSGDTQSGTIGIIIFLLISLGYLIYYVKKKLDKIDLVEENLGKQVKFFKNTIKEWNEKFITNDRLNKLEIKVFKK